MAEYIEREAFLEHMMGTSRYFTVKFDIENFPSADVAPVVRCKDCKHKGWVQEPCHGKSVDYCRVWDCTLRDLESTFCSYGERKDRGAE